MAEMLHTLEIIIIIGIGTMGIIATVALTAIGGGFVWLKHDNDKLSTRIDTSESKLSTRIDGVKEASATAHKTIQNDLTAVKVQQGKNSEIMKRLEEKVDDLKKANT